MAYGLHVVSPWGGTVFINLPEQLEYMPGTRGIARHHDERDIVWQIEDGESLPTMRPRASVNPGSSFAPRHGPRGARPFSVFHQERDAQQAGQHPSHVLP